MTANIARTVPLALVGPGAVGRSLLTQIVATRRLHADRYGLRLGVAAVADSTGVVAASNIELSDQEIARLIGHKGAGRPIASLATARAISQPGGLAEPLELNEPLELEHLAGPGRFSRLATDAAIGRSWWTRRRPTPRRCWWRRGPRAGGSCWPTSCPSRARSRHTATSLVAAAALGGRLPSRPRCP